VGIKFEMSHVLLVVPVRPKSLGLRKGEQVDDRRLSLSVHLLCYDVAERIPVLDLRNSSLGRLPLDSIPVPPTLEPFVARRLAGGKEDDVLDARRGLVEASEVERVHDALVPASGVGIGGSEGGKVKEEGSNELNSLFSFGRGSDEEAGELVRGVATTTKTRRSGPSRPGWQW
jgi:hypothetical protein